MLASVSYTLGANARVEIMSSDDPGGTATIDLTGNNFANRIIGNAGANALAGRGGADILLGAAGDDRLNGGSGADRSDGGLGDDFHYVDNSGDIIVERVGEGSDRVLTSVDYALAAGVEVELFTTTAPAGTSAIDLTGNEFGNRIIGNEGENQLAGGSGADVLTGDLITDFEGAGVAGGDLIDLSVIDAVPGGADDAFTLIAGGAFTASGQLRIVYLAGSDETVILGNTDADSGAEFQIALSGNLTDLVSGDFIL